MKKIIRITTVPVSLGGLLKGQLKFMKDHFEIIGISTGGSILDKVGETEEIRVIPINMTRKITPYKDFVAIIKLARVLKREKPFIVHTHTPKAGTVGMIASWLVKVPNRLHTVAGLPLVEARGLKRIVLNFVEKITYACATKVYPNSKGLKDIILKNNFAAEKKLHVIGHGSSNGIDVSFFDKLNFNEDKLDKLKKELIIEKGDFVFVFVGRLVKDKGIHELIAAFVKVYEKYKQSKLLLVGSYERDLDPIDPETENIIDTHPNIISVGWQKDVRPYFAISDALVFPSYREGFPNVVMQAGAMELPSIVSDINGCNEIIHHGINGTIVPPKKITPFENDMKTLISDNKLRNKMAASARKIICENYEQKFVWQSILNEYQKLESPDINNPDHV